MCACEILGRTDLMGIDSVLPSKSSIQQGNKGGRDVQLDFDFFFFFFAFRTDITPKKTFCSGRLKSRRSGSFHSSVGGLCAGFFSFFSKMLTDDV